MAEKKAINATKASIVNTLMPYVTEGTIAEYNVAAARNAIMSRFNNVGCQIINKPFTFVEDGITHKEDRFFFCVLSGRRSLKTVVEHLIAK